MQEQEGDSMGHNLLQAACPTSTVNPGMCVNLSASVLICKVWITQLPTSQGYGAAWIVSVCSAEPSI